MGIKHSVKAGQGPNRSQAPRDSPNGPEDISVPVTIRLPSLMYAAIGMIAEKGGMTVNQWVYQVVHEDFLSLPIREVAAKRAATRKQDRRN